MNKKIFIIFLFTAISNLLFAQTIKVYDNSTLQPLNKVTIKNSDDTKTVFTNEKGEADASSIASSSSFTISSIGYRTVTLLIDYAVKKLRLIVRAAKQCSPDCLPKFRNEK